MATKVYGTSDDLIEFEGDVAGEVGAYGTDDKPHGVLLVFSDGTMLEVKYGKANLGIWGVTVLAHGGLLENVTDCTNEDATPYSDVAHFGPGLEWCYAAKEWERVS